MDIYDQLKSNLLSFIKEEAIAELEQMRNYKIKEEFHWKTEIGRYSYGPICRNHEMIEKIGNFCSFADGVDAVQNHPMDYLTTHPMLYAGKVFGDYEVEYSTYSTEKWYFQGVQSHRAFDGRKRTIIGNDVWLGRNVTITNGANIGNGVIAGAGAIITKDVPDFAIVTGIPARIVRYRYDKNQIEALNKIAWWDWSDDEIRERYDDLYLPVDSFIKKYI